jgi:16S rRNA C967 or C1407 C5-methylase (RsmB/RsmF family)
VLAQTYLLSSKDNNKTPQAQQIKVTKTEKAPTELPDKFPKDIPMETGAKVVQNYNATTEDGRFQATRVFESKKTIDENLKIYEEYLKTSKYTLDPVVSVNNYKAVSGKKLNAQLQISLDYNTNTKISTVSINYTEVGKVSVPGGNNSK